MRPKRRGTAFADAPLRGVAAALRMTGPFLAWIALASILLAGFASTSPAATAVESMESGPVAPSVRQEPLPSDDPSSPEPVEPIDDDDEGEGEGGEPPAMEPPPVVPDSLRMKPAPEGGGAPIETLVVVPKNVLGKPTAAAPDLPKKKGTPFGIHPVAILAVLVVGHVFLVRAVTD